MYFILKVKKLIEENLDNINKMIEDVSHTDNYVSMICYFYANFID